MEIPINFEGFEGRGLKLQSAGIFSGPKLFVDGAPVKQEKKRYVIRNNNGKEVEVKIQSKFLDPIPKVEIASRVIELARPLKWYEYTWMGLPIILIFIGGALGALFGIMAVYSSSRVFRSERTAIAKYIIIGAISLCAVLVYFVLAIMLQSIIASESLLSANYSSPISKSFLDDTQKVKLLWASGKYSDSLTAAQGLLSEATSDSEKAIAHYWIGLSYYHLNNITQTKQEELLAVKLDSKFDGPYVTLAAISLSVNDCQQALNYSQTAVNLDNNWSWGHNDLGLSYICLGDRDRGINELRKAVELAPESYVFQDNLHRALQQK